ncbi:MAG: hypothetical protein ACMXYF_02830 [Candidatus Woesearchaeota archaeon]
MRVAIIPEQTLDTIQEFIQNPPKNISDYSIVYEPLAKQHSVFFDEPFFTNMLDIIKKGACLQEYVVLCQDLKNDWLRPFLKELNQESKKQSSQLELFAEQPQTKHTQLSSLSREIIENLQITVTYHIQILEKLITIYQHGANTRY